MSQRLSDEQVSEIREMAASGASSSEIAEEFGCSRRHVDRLVRGDQRQQTGVVDDGPVAGAVRRFLEDLELSGADEVLAATAETLAVKLDSVRSSDSAASAAAAPGLARQLAETMREIRGEQGDVALQVRRMLEPLVRGGA